MIRPQRGWCCDSCPGHVDEEQVYKFVQALTTDNTTKAAKSADLAKLGKRLLAQMDGADVDDDVDNEVSVELHARIAAHFPNGARPEQVAPACCIGLLGKWSRLAGFRNRCMSS